jgi:5-methylthioadenosine/S-adenosylhomocysteine deaminase
MSEQIILYGDHLLTGIGEPPIVNGAVVMERGKVLCSGPFHEMFNRYPLARRVGGAGKVVIPGLIDSHQHGRGLTSIQRGVPDGPLEEWLVRLRGLWPVSPYLATSLAAIRLLKSGVTTAMHHFASGGIVPLHEEMAACLNAYRDVGLRVTFTFDFRDINSYVYQSDDTFLATLPPGLAEVIRSQLPGRVLPSPSESSEWIEDIRAQYTSPTIQFALGPQGADWASDALLRDISEFSQKHRMPVHTHMLETRRQRQSSLMTYGRTPVQRLSQFGLLTSDTSLAHMVWVDESDLDLLERSGACIAHNPASNLRLRSGRAPVQQMIERGIRVGIGMDGMGLSDRSEFFHDLRLFAALHFETSAIFERAAGPTPW